MATTEKPVSAKAKKKVKEDKRPVSLIALKTDKSKYKRFHKEGSKFKATEQTAKALIKAGIAKKD